MARTTSTRLSATSRQAGGSRTARRLRHTGNVPGVIYGGSGEPEPVTVDGRDLRLALARAGAVLELSIDGAGSTLVVLKEAQHHPVNGETMHVDLLRVRLDQAIHAMVALELTGIEEAPGIKEGGVLEQITRELNVEALPNEIPDVIQHDVSALELGATLTLTAIAAPAGVTLLDDPEETVVATVTLPRLSTDPDEEIEQETELVGEGDGEAAEGEDGAPAQGKADAGDGGD